MTALVSRETMVRRAIPKIRGSSGAFIAVVVVLVLIIVVACSAVVYLLLESRKTRNGPHQRYQVPTSRNLELGGSTVGGPPPSRLRSAVDRFLGRHKANNLSDVGEPQTPRRSGQSWVKAAGQDYENIGSLSPGMRGHGTQMSEVLQMDNSLPPSVVASLNSSPTLRPKPLDPRERVSSMLSDTSMSVASYREGTTVRYPEPFAPAPQRSISNITGQLSPSMFSSPASSPPPSVIGLSVNRLASSSPEPILEDDGDGDVAEASEARVYPSARGRSFATQSGVSMRTFDTGSKFIEGL
ncbi:hypothetical protein DFP72DRAFT_868781 [Ephemerocybe angulata]|uniref:Uncharacterized protein n=1 Tax=Ephemerocybe angulata TaxID=980116 RepID=A0A8H6IIV8_9AGAR|nr:hypothetical protein DFP72DRAFT_868781 [Tulosesus angulatus]